MRASNKQKMDFTFSFFLLILLLLDPVLLFANLRVYFGRSAMVVQLAVNKKFTADLHSNKPLKISVYFD